MLLAAAAAGCGTPNKTAVSGPVVASRDAGQWTTRNFTVRFQASAGTRDGGTGSAYALEELGHGHSGPEVIPSGHSRYGRPQDFIRVVEDASGEALVIEENVPNDCAPCSNYIWVGRDPRGALTHPFLKLPTRPVSQVDFENPTVHGIRGSKLIYQFSEGPPITVDLRDLEKADKPELPG